LTLYQILMAHHEQEAQPLNLVRPEIPVELAAVVARMMAKQPQRRFQTPKEVAQALKPFAKPARGEPERSQAGPSRTMGPGAGREAPGVFRESTQVATDPASAPGTAARKWANPPPAHSAREPELPLAAAGRRRPPWLGPTAAAAVFLLGLVIIWALAASRDRTDIPGGRLAGSAGDRKPPDDRTTPSPAHQEAPDDLPKDFGAVKTVGRPTEPLGWVSLFNGKDLTGWKTHPSQPGRWRVEDGVLIGGTSPTGSHLSSERDDFHDVHLRVEARFNASGRGGVYLRSTFGPRLPVGDPSRPAGYEALINTTCGKEANRTGILDPGDPAHEDVWRSSSAPRTIPPGRWFTLEFIADGNILTTLLDGRTTAYHVDPMRRYTSGHITLQQNDPQTVIEFRKIEIRELNRPGQKDPREIRRFVGHGTRVNQVVFSPDEGTILSGGHSEEVLIPSDGTAARWLHGHANTVRLWETDTGRLALPPMKGHNHPVFF
jgi:hypothetical protein